MWHLKAPIHLPVIPAAAAMVHASARAVAAHEMRDDSKASHIRNAVLRIGTAMCAVALLTSPAEGEGDALEWLH